MIKVMFLCTGNSCRSQMAEGLARAHGGDSFEIHSAGLFPVGVNPHAVKVMKEIDIDISGQLSEAIDPELLYQMDLVITLCGNAETRCPVTPPGIKRLHWPIDDPVGAVGTEDEILSEFRRARDEIKEKIVLLLDSIKNPSE